jgi:CRISPR-associated endonuclease Cas1
MTNGHTLLINESFALRQNNGMPVFTEIKTVERPYTKAEIDGIIDNQNKQRRDKGLTIVESFDVEYKEMLRKTSKKIRTKTDYPIDLFNLERIIMTPNAHGYISTAFLEFAKIRSIPIYWVDVKGKLEASFIPYNFVKPSLVVKQCNAIINGKALDICKYLIMQKLESQGFDYVVPNLRKAKNVRDVLSIEGACGKEYYKKWSFDSEWRWTGRHGGTNKSFNYMANDPINACLNLGYSILAQQFSEILIKRGFEISIGFLHVNETSQVYWNRLAWDFIEPYRVWIDNTVKEMIANKEIKPTDFKYSDDRSHMIFKDKGLEIVLNRFMEILDPLEHKSLQIIRHVEEML